MPSQFRSFGADASSEPSEAPQVDMSSAENAPSLFERIRVALAPQMSREDPRASNEVGQSPDDTSPASGLQQIVKNTDYWFNLELSLLEKYAVTSAVQWAQAGIPRQDAPLQGELPIETTLKSRGSEIFQGWIARIKRKVQDSVQAASADAGSRIVQFRHAVAQLERTTAEIDTVKGTIVDREEALRNQQREFGAPAHLPRSLYILLLCGVAIIDWIANVPIFNELLPQEPGSRLIWRKLVADTAQMGATGGLHRLLDRILFQPDVTVFALGVITFLMVLAHFGGEALRRWMVFRPEDEPLLASSLKAQRRQALIPMSIALLGILLAIGFLYGSRSRLVNATTNGINASEATVRKLEGDTSNIKMGHGDLSQLPSIEQKLESATSVLKDWQERARFANDISMMNTPILLLNIVLALTALAAAYCAAAPKIVEGRLADPVIPDLKTNLASLRMELVNHRQVLRALDGEIRTSMARAKYLAATRPLSEWEAKAQRLQAVVPLFRAENARARGVDPESIVAFRQPAMLELPAVTEEPFQVAVELAAWEEEFRTLRRALGADASEGRMAAGVGA